MADTYTYSIEILNKNNVLSTLTRYGSVIQIYQISTGEWTTTEKVIVSDLLDMLKSNDYLYCRIVQN